MMAPKFRMEDWCGSDKGVGAEEEAPASVKLGGTGVGKNGSTSGTRLDTKGVGGDTSGGTSVINSGSTLALLAIQKEGLVSVGVDFCWV